MPKTNDGVWHLETPPRKYRLHNLETMRNPFHAIEDGLFVHARFGRARQLEHNFGLDLRFAEP
jgi:hypothetical protein